MLKFFRHIRKNLIDKGKMGRYLKYAIGEIILVVIGILIALQINNWNFQRIEKLKEVDYLKEIKANLLEDKIDLSQCIQFYAEKTEAIEATLKSFGESESNGNILMNLARRMDILGGHDPFVKIRNAFDNMISAQSIDVISDNELRKRLSTYYTISDHNFGTQEFAKQLGREFSRMAGPYLMTHEIIKTHMNIDLPLKKSNSVVIAKDEEIISKLVSMFMNIRILSSEHDHSMNEIDNLIERIDLVLNK